MFEEIQKRGGYIFTTFRKNIYICFRKKGVTTFPYITIDQKLELYLNITFLQFTCVIKPHPPGKKFRTKITYLTTPTMFTAEVTSKSEKLLDLFWNDLVTKENIIDVRYPCACNIVNFCSRNQSYRQNVRYVFFSEIELKVKNRWW